MDKSSFYGVKNLAYDIYRKFEAVCLQIGFKISANVRFPATISRFVYYTLIPTSACADKSPLCLASDQSLKYDYSFCNRRSQSCITFFSYCVIHITIPYQQEIQLKCMTITPFPVIVNQKSSMLLNNNINIITEA